MLPNTRLERIYGSWIVWTALNMWHWRDGQQIQDHPHNSIFSSDSNLIKAWFCKWHTDEFTCTMWQKNQVTAGRYDLVWSCLESSCHMRTCHSCFIQKDTSTNFGLTPNIYRFYECLLQSSGHKFTRPSGLQEGVFAGFLVLEIITRMHLLLGSAIFGGNQGNHFGSDLLGKIQWESGGMMDKHSRKGYFSCVGICIWIFLIPGFGNSRLDSMLGLSKLASGPRCTMVHTWEAW